MRTMWMLLLPALAQAKSVPHAAPVQHMDEKLAVKPAPPPAEGFTVDATAFLFAHHQDIEGPLEDGNDDPRTAPVLCTVSLVDVIDVATQKATTYLHAAAGDDCSKAASLPGVQPTAALGAFLKAHPLGTLHGPKGPKGSQVVGLGGVCSSLTCTDATCKVALDPKVKGCLPPPPEDGPPADEGSLDVGVKRPDGRVHLAHHVYLYENVQVMSSARVETYWLPDESAAALVFSEKVDIPRGISSFTQTPRLIKFAPVRVRVLGYSAEWGASQKLADAAAAPVRALGYEVSTAPTKDARKDAVVYAAAGFEADAAKIAAAVPGAHVEKLTWKADAEVVVAVAAPPKAAPKPTGKKGK